MLKLKWSCERCGRMVRVWFWKWFKKNAVVFCWECGEELKERCGSVDRVYEAFREEQQR